MKYIYLLIAVLFLGVGCKDDDTLPVVVPDKSGTWEDADGNVYEWVRIGKLEWLTSNLKTGTPYWYADYDLAKYGIYATGFSETEEGSEEERRDLKKYGNLYEWQTACEICETLGDGWRLPSDADWQDLEREFGMGGEAAENGWRGNGIADMMRQKDDGAKFGLQIAGAASVKAPMGRLRVFWVNEKGYYWSSTQNEDGKVYYRKLHYNSSDVYRNCITPIYVPMMRVRVCRDAVDD